MAVVVQVFRMRLMSGADALHLGIEPTMDPCTALHQDGPRAQPVRNGQPVNIGGNDFPILHPAILTAEILGTVYRFGQRPGTEIAVWTAGNDLHGIGPREYPMEIGRASCRER